MTETDQREKKVSNSGTLKDGRGGPPKEGVAEPASDAILILSHFSGRGTDSEAGTDIPPERMLESAPGAIFAPLMSKLSGWRADSEEDADACLREG